MRRFGDRESFLGLLDDVRRRVPNAGIRSNVIVGFPGEREKDRDELEQFLVGARLDVVGVFGYSDEDGTEAAGFEDKLDEDEVRTLLEKLEDRAAALELYYRAREVAAKRMDVTALATALAMNFAYTGQLTG